MPTRWKSVHVIALVAAGMLLNILGRALAQALQPPLWLDSFGTVLVAYLLGPFAGAVVGACSQLTIAFTSGSSPAYALTGLAIGTIVGFVGRKDVFRTLFGTMQACSAVTLASVAISVPLSMLLYGGMTGNLWGDGVINLLLEQGVAPVLCYVAGQLAIDFVDKVLTLNALSLALRVFRRSRGDWGEDAGDRAAPDANGTRQPRAQLAGRSMAILLGALLVTQALVGGVATAQAASFSSSAGSADFYSYVQTVYSSDNGLPSGESNDIAQTKDGILWIGTYAGLYRYNGSEFRSMQKQIPSVKNVNCLYVDPEGRLWIGTNDNGLTLCVNERVTNVLDMSSGMPSNSIRSIERGADGLYYVGTSDALQILDLENGMILVDQLKDVTYASGLSADSLGHVAAVTAKGKLFILAQGKVVTQLEPEGENTSYTCCLYESDDTLLAGTANGRVRRFRLTGNALELVEERSFDGVQEINSLFRTLDGLLFLCSDSGVSCLDAQGSYQKINLVEFNDSVDRMTQDYQGNYWFTSSRLGLLRLAPSAFSDIYAAAGITRQVVNAVVPWQGALYMGTDRGLDAVDPITRKSVTNKLTELLAGVRTRCMTVDRQGNLWLCTYGRGGLCVTPAGDVTYYNTTSGTFSDRARSVLELSDGRIALAGDAGLALIRDGKVEQLLPYSEDFVNAQVLTMVEKPDGALLVGSDGVGIVELADGKVVRRYTHEQGLSSDVILRIAATPDAGSYYVVTSNGLCLLNDGEGAKQLDSFPYSNNFDIWTYKSRAFVLSSAGIYVVDEHDLRANEPGMAYELLDHGRGLNASLTANSWAWRDQDASLYVCTDSGAFVLELSDYGHAHGSYRLKMGEASADGTSLRVERGETLTLPRDTHTFTLRPEVISYTLNDPIVSYQLEGYDTTPVQRSLSDMPAELSYTNLPSGEYSFRISVLDSDHNVLEESSYAVYKELAIQDHWWFLVYMILVGMLIVAWITWFLARTQAQRALALKQRELELAHQQMQMGNETIIAIARAVDAKDASTSMHSARVAEYAVLLAQEMGCSPEECANLHKAALLHDIGKIGIPDRVLNKPGRLTDEEYQLMKTHVLRGGEILKDFTIVEHAADGALYHHERWDGRGYASGLAGEEIPLYGRIIAVADAFDAITQNRVYRKRHTIEFAEGEIEKGAGTQFDPNIAAIMLRLIREHKIDRVLKLGSEDVATLVDGDLAASETPVEHAGPAAAADAGPSATADARRDADGAPDAEADARVQGHDEGEATQA